MDKFEEIKANCHKKIPGAAGLAIDQLIAEVERLRKIEDAALNWIDQGFTPEGGFDFHEVAKANPRPEE